MRALLPLFLFASAFACQVAPAESPDDVVARENARVAAAKRHAEDQEKRQRLEAETKRRADQEARLAREQEEQAKKGEAQRQKEQSCQSDRAERRRHVQDALDKAAKDRARAAELESYIAKTCTRKEVPDYDNQQYVDERGYVRTRQVAVGKHDEIACPPDAPPELRPGGSGIPSGIVAIQASADERVKNDRCQDVQDLLKK